MAGERLLVKDSFISLLKRVWSTIKSSMRSLLACISFLKFFTCPSFFSRRVTRFFSLPNFTFSQASVKRMMSFDIFLCNHKDAPVMLEWAEQLQTGLRGSWSIHTSVDTAYHRSIKIYAMWCVWAPLTLEDTCITFLRLWERK